MDTEAAAAFYAQQDRWAAVYQGDVEDAHRRNARLIRRLAGRSGGHILDLGCGGGQNAAAAVEMGFSVVAIDIVPSVLRRARELAASARPGALRVIEADFYEAQLEERFDVVCYWDGFGVGADSDQRKLLRRIASWLVPAGCALIEVYTPRYWAAVAGRQMTFGRVCRRYGFDSERCRMTDRWWPSGEESRAIVQSLRCYSLDDLRLLVRETGLRLDEVAPGGALDFETMRYHENVGLQEAMQYVAKLVPG